MSAYEIDEAAFCGEGFECPICGECHIPMNHHTNQQMWDHITRRHEAPDGWDTEQHRTEYFQHLDSLRIRGAIERTRATVTELGRQRRLLENEDKP